MNPKGIVKSPDTKKNILVVPSRVVNRPSEQQGGEEIEIAAQISVPHEGGWGWVVVCASFWCIFVLDGVVYTFGSLLTNMTKDLGVDISLVALLNSIAVAVLFIASPMASALINRFGFRSCAMTGSVCCSFSLFFSHFASNYASLVIFYGLIAGFGYSLINMAACLIVGFYFEKLRSLAISLAISGSSAGLMTLFPLNTYLVGLSDWRKTTLLHSGLFGTIFFVTMAFRPLLSLTVVQTTDDPTRTVTYLPNLSRAAVPPPKPGLKTPQEGLKATVAERLFNAVSNANFPTAANVVDESTSPTATQPGPSTGVAASRLTLTANNPQGSVSRRHLKQVQSIMSRASSGHDKKNLEITIHVEEKTTKPGCCGRLCHWEEEVPQSRPMYRDDAFYEGKVEKLPIYQKSMVDTSGEAKTGLEYQMAVSRAVTAGDLREKRGVFTTAVRRVLATMMDPKLLKRPSFIILTFSGFLTYVGFLVPFVFLKTRNSEAGISEEHCSWIITVLGFSTAFGRLSLGALAVKLDPFKLYLLASFVAGLSTLLSVMSFGLYYQYAYSFAYGCCVGSLYCLKSLFVVNLYGLDKLTNATGMILLFQGFGSLISTPLAGVLKNQFGYMASFSVAGGIMILASVILLPLKKLVNKENKESNIKK